MNESPNYHSLNTCAQDLKSPERLLLLTIFIMMSVIALDRTSTGGRLWWCTALGQQWAIFPPDAPMPQRCHQHAQQDFPSLYLPVMNPKHFVPFHPANPSLSPSCRRRIGACFAQNSICCGWAGGPGPSRWGGLP